MGIVRWHRLHRWLGAQRASPARTDCPHGGVAGCQCRHQDLLDIGQKPVAVDRPIQNRRRGQHVLTQTGKEGGGLPASARAGADQQFAARRAAVQSDHVGFGPGFIEEGQLARVQVGLGLGPFSTGLGNVRAVPLSGVQGLFSCQVHWTLAILGNVSNPLTLTRWLRDERTASRKMPRALIERPCRRSMESSRPTEVDPGNWTGS